MNTAPVIQIIYNCADCPVSDVRAMSGWIGGEHKTWYTFTLANGKTVQLDATLIAHGSLRELERAIYRCLYASEVGSLLRLDEARALVRILMDETQSRAVYARCAAWLE